MRYTRKCPKLNRLAAYWSRKAIKQRSNTALAKLENYAKSSPEIAAQSERLSSEIEYFYNKMRVNYKKSVLRKTIIALSTIVALIIVGFIGYFSFKFYQQKMYEKQQRILAEQYEESLRQKSNNGYDIVEKDGKKVAVWVADRKHPTNNWLIAKENEGEWNCEKPGYVWTGGDQIAWKAGLIHPNNSKLTSAAEIDKWVANVEGYVWDGEDKVKWVAGIKSKKFPHWISHTTQDEWMIEEGYKKKDPNSKTICEAVWDVGYITSDRKRKASSTEGVWLNKTNCSSCNASGRVASSSQCWNCGGSGEIEEKEQCSNCNGSRKVSSWISCSNCGGDGKVTSACDATYNNTSCGAVYNSTTGAVSTQHGYVCAPCNGWGNIWGIQCSTCNGYGYLTCGPCNETGYIEKDCSDCAGQGTYLKDKTCYNCDYNGLIKVKKTCSYCKYGQIVSNNKCHSCDGEGYIWK